MDIYLTICLSLAYFICFSSAQSFDYPTANVSTSWTNSPSLPHSVSFSDGSLVRAILLRGTFGPRFACGFYCNGNCDSYLFAIFIVQTNSASLITSPSIGFPQVVWSANRNNPVRINATLQLTVDGDLVLKDVDGTIAWSTNTSGKSVSGLNLSDKGNLVLFDHSNATVWQSFDHPTDCLVPGQKLMEGQKLYPSISSTNWTRLSLISLSVTAQGLFALVESSPPQVYQQFTVGGTKTKKEPTYVSLQNGSLALFVNSSDPSKPDRSLPLPAATSAQHMRFGADGHLRLYEWGSQGWTQVADVLKLTQGECFYPTVCGSYGICSNGQCSCPPSNYFRQINDRQPDLGCAASAPLSCQHVENHSFIELKDTTYFAFESHLENVDSERCKAACLENCSCKAAIFRFGSDPANGFCYLPNLILSLINNDPFSTHYNSTVYVKVQNLPTAEAMLPRPKTKNRAKIILVSSLGSFFGLLILVGICMLLVRKKKEVDETEEDYLDHVPGMPTRFSYEDLKAFTDDFSKVLGEGGFGSVFEGTLIDGTKIAVKRLNGLVQVNKSFLAEVESIGSIHHVKLVRLLGFCADKSHRLLVYEFMCNGSLDKWIFNQTSEYFLDWKQRKKIILDIANGLTYLHEECNQKVIHLDIKPQNILLDSKFSAKISDFGLSKLIDRDQSKVVTTMRGTPGYLAPEWLSSVITEKVDIYSFGVVVLEILCGRKNIDSSQPEEQMHLLRLFERKADENRLFDLVDHSIEDVKILHSEEIMNLMKLAAWCLQKDHSKRPCMSLVVKVLEGFAQVEYDLNFNLSKLEVNKVSTEFTPLLPFVLSGPR